MPIRTVYASSIAPLDSNVFTGGGTDATQALQKVLDLAVTEGGIHLVMDGAALIRGLRLHSNTTIECLTKDCGFFLADQSNGPLVINADYDKKVIRNRCISLLGGTYNHNAAHQLHDAPVEDPALRFGAPGDIDDFGGNRLVIALEFYGVEYLTLRDLTIRNQRAWTAVFCNWRHVVVENVDIDLPEHIDSANQDGLHFWGPGRFLSMKNISGRTGDDIIALAPDEADKESSIEDVEIDGVFMDNADQGIRLLSRAKGRLDRVTIRNVTGTYKCFGFYINPWFDDGYGSFGNILIENVDLRQTEPNYHYTNPFVFRIGGDIECLTLKDIRYHNPGDERPIAEIGVPFVRTKANEAKGQGQHMQTVIIDGLTVLENDNDFAQNGYIRIVDRVDRLIVRNVLAVRGGEPNGKLISFTGRGAAGDFLADGVLCRGYDCFLEGIDRIDRCALFNVDCDSETTR